MGSGTVSLYKYQGLLRLVKDLKAWRVFLKRHLTLRPQLLLPALMSAYVLSKPIDGAQWLSDRVFDSGRRGRGFEPHRHHCVVVLEQDTFILA